MKPRFRDALVVDYGESVGDASRSVRFRTDRGRLRPYPLCRENLCFRGARQAGTPKFTRPQEGNSTTMRNIRIFGAVLVVVGAVLIIFGIADSRSVANNVSTFFSGHLTRNTMWYIGGGIVSAVVGLLLSMGIIGRARS